jgi:hypothetical protein
LPVCAVGWWCVAYCDVTVPEQSTDLARPSTVDRLARTAGSDPRSEELVRIDAQAQVLVVLAH